MKRSYTQKDIYDYLCANPLHTKVHVGDLEDMNGQDYIFIDYSNDIPMLRDNEADYQSVIQISVLTRNYEDRKTLVKHIREKFLIAPVYSKSDEFEYYQAQFTTGLFIHEDEPSSI